MDTNVIEIIKMKSELYDEILRLVEEELLESARKDSLTNGLINEGNIRIVGDYYYDPAKINKLDAKHKVEQLRGGFGMTLDQAITRSNDRVHRS